MSNIRLGSDDLAYGLGLARKEEAIQTYEREIALQTDRLRELLEGDRPLSRDQAAKEAGLSNHQRKTALRVANVPELAN